MRSLVSMALIAIAFITPIRANSGGGGGDAVGSLPNTSSSPAKPGPCSGSEKAGPGESTPTNADGVSGSVSSGGSGSVKVDGGGQSDCVTNASTKSGTKVFNVTGTDGNDVTTVGASSTGTVSGAGGVVKLASNCKVTVTNTAAAGSNINTTVILAGGQTATVPPGSSVTFGT